MSKGSWEGDIRIWKLDSKLKSFSQVGTVSAPGIINSLQLLSPPKGFFQDVTWITARSNEAHAQTVQPILLVAGIGQEHRLGRWLTVKEGVVNGTVVYALSP